MIITEIRGRLGNALFQIAVGLYLSKKLNVEFAVIPNKKSRLDYYYNEIFPFEFFNKFKCLDLNYDMSKFKTIHDNKKHLSYKDFPVKDNIIISDWFLGKNYVHYETIKDIYVPSKELTEELFDLYNPTRNSLMINIRRGDFLEQKNIDLGWYSAPKKYWKSTYEYLNKKYDKVFVTTDDIEWCKENIDFCDNLVIVDKKTENSKIFADLFLGSFVGDHIISASTFSWWQAYLNPYKNKQVIMPYPWNTILTDKRNKQYYLNDSIKFDIYNYTKI